MDEKAHRSAWLDTNVILRFLLKDDLDLFRAVEPLFLQAEEGEMVIFIHPLIMAELVWTLESFYEYPKSKIREVLEGLIGAQGVEVPEKEVIILALADYEEKNVDYIDAYLANFALRQGPSTIYTLDSKHFSRLRGDINLPTA